MRRMLSIVVDGLVGDPQFGIHAEGVPGVGVAFELREVAAGYLYANLMALEESAAG